MIGNRPMGPDHPPMVIAEMSGNHNQSLDRAFELVDAAAAAHSFWVVRIRSTSMRDKHMRVSRIDRYTVRVLIRVDVTNRFAPNGAV